MDIAIGIIIGGLITIITNYCLEKQREKKEIKLDNLANLRNAYIDFRILHQKIFTWNLYKSNGKKKPYDDEREFNELREKVKVMVDAYFPSHLKKVAHDIDQLILPKSETENNEFNKLRQKKLEYLNNEMSKILDINY